MSDGQDRRTFLKQSAVAASALAAGCTSDGDTAGGDASLPGDILRAVAAVTLPSELGAERRERVVAGFESWLAAYTPVAERVHGYGSQEITFGPPHPGPGWAAQLEALGLEAEARHGASFVELSASDRRALVEAAVESSGDASLGGRPGALEARHVVVGLLGYFYGSSEATDMCYARGIGGHTCRPLSASTEIPAPLDDMAFGPPIGTSGVASRARPPSAGRIELGLEPGS